MKKIITSLALSAVALSHTMASAAQPVALERSGSSVSDAEGQMAGGAGIFAVIAAIAIGIGAIVLIEDEEDDVPDSP